MQNSIEIEVIRRPRPMVFHSAGTEATFIKHKKPSKETTAFTWTSYWSKFPPINSTHKKKQQHTLAI